MPKDGASNKVRSSSKQSNQRYVVETITMTTVTERRIVTDTANATAPSGPPPVPVKTSSLRKTASNSSNEPETTSASENHSTSTYLNSTASSDSSGGNSISSQISGILKGGKLWKNEQVSFLTNSNL